MHSSLIDYYPPPMHNTTCRLLPLTSKSLTLAHLGENATFVILPLMVQLVAHTAQNASESILTQHTTIIFTLLSGSLSNYYTQIVRNLNRLKENHTPTTVCVSPFTVVNRILLYDKFTTPCYDDAKGDTDIDTFTRYNVAVLVRIYCFLNCLLERRTSAFRTLIILCNRKLLGYVGSLYCISMYGSQSQIELHNNLLKASTASFLAQV